MKRIICQLIEYWSVTSVTRPKIPVNCSDLKVVNAFIYLELWSDPFVCLFADCRISNRITKLCRMSRQWRSNDKRTTCVNVSGTSCQCRTDCLSGYRKPPSTVRSTPLWRIDERRTEVPFLFGQLSFPAWTIVALVVQYYALCVAFVARVIVWPTVSLRLTPTAARNYTSRRLEESTHITSVLWQGLLASIRSMLEQKQGEKLETQCE